MESFLKTLSDTQPLVILIMLIVMFSIENVWPYLPKPGNRKRHDSRNYILSFISLAVNIFAGIISIIVLQFVANRNLGLLNWIPLTLVLKITLGVFLIDFGSYCGHVLAHKVPLLWRSHRVHHSDPNLMSSSSLRFHPFDVLYSQLLWFAVVYIVFGISMESFIIYGSLLIPLLICQHSNVKFPDWFEKYVRYLFSTPGWHKIHHGADQTYTDSHYGDLFTLWDRLFGTYHNVHPDEIAFGLNEFNDDKQHKVGYLLSVPFKNLNPKIKD